LPFIASLTLLLLAPYAGSGDGQVALASLRGSEPFTNSQPAAEADNLHELVGVIYSIVRDDAK
jgi:hypothetical protein